jgi:hypothetical protein
MAQAKVFNGAQALMYVDGILVGLFDSCTYTVNITTEAIHILGRYSAAEITPTAYEAVDVNCSGFRIIGNGGHKLPKFPKLQDILNLETITLTLVNRKGGPQAAPIMVVENCVPTSLGNGAQAKSTSRIQVSYRGTKASDEDGIQDEGGAANLP